MIRRSSSRNDDENIINSFFRLWRRKDHSIHNNMNEAMNVKIAVAAIAETEVVIAEYQ